MGHDLTWLSQKTFWVIFLFTCSSLLILALIMAFARIRRIFSSALDSAMILFEARCLKCRNFFWLAKLQTSLFIHEALGLRVQWDLTGMELSHACLYFRMKTLYQSLEVSFSKSSEGSQILLQNHPVFSLNLIFCNIT